jgi:hypothetical protein
MRGACASRRLEALPHTRHVGDESGAPRRIGAILERLLAEAKAMSRPVST